MDLRIEECSPADLPNVARLLSSAGLPEAALGRHPETILLGAREGKRLVGCAALEIYGDVGLLRSVAVATEARRKGLGRRLTDAALDLSRQRELTAVYLLTETAAAFFARQGFIETDRGAAPSALARSEQFAVACPEGATCMVFQID